MTTIGTNPLLASTLPPSVTTTSTLPPSVTTRGTNERLGDAS